MLGKISYFAGSIILALAVGHEYSQFFGWVILGTSGILAGVASYITGTN